MVYGPFSRWWILVRRSTKIWWHPCHVPRPGSGCIKKHFLWWWDQFCLAGIKGIRTSLDHGTACNAGQNKADPSMKRHCFCDKDLIQNRSDYPAISGLMLWIKKQRPSDNEEEDEILKTLIVHLSYHSLFSGLSKIYVSDSLWLVLYRKYI